MTDEKQKPREFWIELNPQLYFIKYSAYEQVQAKLEKYKHHAEMMREALMEAGCNGSAKVSDAISLYDSEVLEDKL